jgi:hypothetical protein
MGGLHYMWGNFRQKPKQNKKQKLEISADGSFFGI